MKINPSFVLFSCVVLSGQAFGLVRHYDPYETSNGDPTGPFQWFARFNGNAAAIAIGPNHILTTRHQGGGVGSTVVFPNGPNAGTYTVNSQTLIGGANTDLRVLTISGTLSTYASLYTGSTSGKTALIGGFGPTRGSTFYTNSSSQLIGYSVSTPSGNSYSLLFGQNRIDALGTSGGTWNTTPLLLADFDGPESVSSPYTGIAPAATDKVDYEAALAEGDSGGGWFINVSGTWKLAGLSHASSLVRINGGVVGDYSNPANGTPAFLFGGQIAAVDLTPFYSEITSSIPEPTCLGVIMIGGIFLTRRRYQSRPQ
ncbi:MAG: hypothetical protein KatS3mg104_2993 [Phycisphaerae bacterium]|jgi:hypothetical protein|nr:MAG: hypothetical protein KatS3mg104_2993 [Phycisphaerae bacterium]